MFPELFTKVRMIAARNSCQAVYFGSGVLQKCIQCTSLVSRYPPALPIHHYKQSIAKKSSTNDPLLENKTAIKQNIGLLEASGRILQGNSKISYSTIRGRKNFTVPSMILKKIEALQDRFIEEKSFHERLQAMENEFHECLRAKENEVYEKSIELLNIRNELASRNAMFLRATNSLFARTVMELFEKKEPFVNSKHGFRHQRWENFLSSDYPGIRDIQDAMFEAELDPNQVPDIACALYSNLKHRVHTTFRPGVDKVVIMTSYLGKNELKLLKIICRYLPLPDDDIVEHEGPAELL